MPGNRGLWRFAQPPQFGLFPWSTKINGYGLSAQRPQACNALLGFTWLSTDVGGGQLYECQLVSGEAAWKPIAAPAGLTVPVGVADGGTGDTSLTQYAVLVGAGTGAVATVGPDSSTSHFLASGGSSANPGFRAVVASDLPSLGAAGSGHAAGIVPDPGSTAGSKRFLREDATWDQVTDANLSISNVTNNNVSTGAHGFAPKLPNDATKYLDGTGAYSVPSGGGIPSALIGVNTQTGSTYTVQSTDANYLVFDDYGAAGPTYTLYNPPSGIVNYSIYSYGGEPINLSVGSSTIYGPDYLPPGAFGLVVADPSTFYVLSGFPNPMTTGGDILVAGYAGRAIRLAGDTSNTRKFLRTLSLSGTAQVPAWDTVQAGDLPVFVGAGASHAAGAVPDPGSTSHSDPYLLGDNASFIQISGAGASYSSGTYTFAATVSSIALTVPSFLSVSGSPITTSGTLAVTLATQSANLVFAGPSSGSAAAPTFRALVTADFPATAVTAGSYGSASQVGTFTVDGTGRLTAASNSSIAIAASAVTSGVLPIVRGGTNSGAALTNNQIIVSSGGALVEAGAMTNGQLMIGKTSGAPTIAAMMQGTGIAITNGAGSITVAGAVFGASGASHSAGDVPDPGASAGSTRFLREDSTWAAPAVGTGTVTSVGLSLPGIFTVSGSPVTTSGTLTGSFANQVANTILAGPSSGGGAAPTFRALVVADLPPVVATGPGKMSGRLTLTTGTPVTTSDVTGASAETIYWTPYNGDVVWVYNGTSWVSYTLAQLSVPITTIQTCTMVSVSTTITVANSTNLFRGMQVTGTGIQANTVISSITDATHVVISNTAIATTTNALTFTAPASTAYDCFGVVVNGALTLQLVPWTSTSSRAQAISLLNGTYVNTSAINATDYNGIAANQGTYLGSICTMPTAGLTEDSAQNRLVWNYFNRINRSVASAVSGSWAYNTGTFRAWNNVNPPFGSGGTTTVAGCVTVMVGVVEDAINLRTVINFTVSAGTAGLQIGIGEDSTTTDGCATHLVTAAVVNAAQGISGGELTTAPSAAGFHYFQALEKLLFGSSVNTENSSSNSGLAGTWKC